MTDQAFGDWNRDCCLCPRALALPLRTARCSSDRLDVNTQVRCYRSYGPLHLRVGVLAVVLACSTPDEQRKDATAQTTRDTPRVATTPQTDTDTAASLTAGVIRNGELRGIAVSGSRLAAGGKDANGRAVVLIFEEATGWRREAPPQAAEMGSVEAVGGIREGFVLFSQPARGRTRLWFSSDGSHWEEVATGEVFARATVTDVTEGGPGLVAVGHRASGRSDIEDLGPVAVWTSRDGRRWQAVVLPTGTFGMSEGSINGVTRGGPGLVAVAVDVNGGHVFTSRDGLTWMRVKTDRATFAGASPTAVTAHDAGLIAVGATLDLKPLVWRSTDGTTWERSSAESDEAGFTALDLAHNGSRLIAVGFDAQGGQIWTSSDARSWRAMLNDNSP